MTNHRETISQSPQHSHTERASVLTSVKGSITLEASMAIPIFVFATVSLLYLMEIMAVQMALYSGMQYAGKVTAQEACMAPAIVPYKIEQQIINAIGVERLERSIIIGGSTGLDCDESKMSKRTGIGVLSVKYKIRIPIPILHIKPVTLKETMRIKAWTGYEKTGFDFTDEQTVYITETGLVYHKDYHCTYLELSIHMVQKNDVDSLRNIDGGKYYPCEYCARMEEQAVYITDSGNRYHSSLSCSGLKRTVYAVPMSEVIGRGACARCGQ